MTIKDLFEMCGNLGKGSYITVMNSRDEVEASGFYTEVFADFGDREITDFRINDDRNATVWIVGYGL